MSPVEPAPTGAGSREPGQAAGDDSAALLKRASRGDQDAFGVLYDRWSARVHGLALRVVRDRAHAEEVTQEVFIEAWRQAARFDPSRGSFGAWLLTMTHRRAVDRVRSADASARREATYHREIRVETHDTTASAAETSLEALRVRAALSHLTEMQREAVTLAYFGGYTHTEVAAMLDLPLGTAKTRIRDGLIRLRDQLGVGGAHS